MIEQKIKPKFVWVVIDCKWHTFRGAYSTKKRALECNPCKKCSVMRVEVL
jgi:hypothetical protein